MGATRHGFRNRSARAMHESHYGPNMTPMVDVVMVILIFFMASAAILGPEWFIKSSLPVMAAPADSRTPPTRITVEVDVGGYALRIDQQPPRPVGESDLVEALAAARAAATGECIALVKPTTKAPYEKVILAQEACLRAGLPRSGLALPGM
jgi:biopolymer transport protein ExbD